jgi:hypothetical protein
VTSAARDHVTRRADRGEHIVRIGIVVVRFGDRRRIRLKVADAVASATSDLAIAFPCEDDCPRA